MLHAIRKHLKYLETDVLHSLFPTVVEKLSKNKWIAASKTLKSPYYNGVYEVTLFLALHLTHCHAKENPKSLALPLDLMILIGI